MAAVKRPEYSLAQEKIDMETALVHDTGDHARHQLLERRERLERVIAEAPDASSLARLLAEVDEALGRIERGAFGVCDVCHGVVEADRIAADPLLRTCLD